MSRQRNSLAELQPLAPEAATRESVERLLHEKKPNFVSYSDWQIIDQLERLFPQNLSVLSIVKRNFAWRLKVETTG